MLLNISDIHLLDKSLVLFFIHSKLFIYACNTKWAITLLIIYVETPNIRRMVSLYPSSRGSKDILHTYRETANLYKNRLTWYIVLRFYKQGI